LPFLPALCRKLLREELLLPSIPTFWCKGSLAEVEARFDDLVIKSALPPVMTRALSPQERAELLAKIRAKPASFVAQERVVPSTTPTMVEGVLAPRSLVLRCFAVSSRGDSYTIMAGGLARVGDPARGAEVSMQLGAQSKDLWVISRDEPEDMSLLPAQQGALPLTRGGGDLPSRVADNLYWLGRYAERAEGIARLARVVAARLADLTSDADLARAAEVRLLLGALHAGSPATITGSEAHVLTAVYDLEQPGSIASVIRATLRVARWVRDRLSMDTWRVLVALEERLGPGRNVVADLNEVVATLAGFSGLVMESMTRGRGWQFLDMGRRLERAIGMVGLLRATLAGDHDRTAQLLEALLEVADSTMTYRRRYRASLQLAPVVDLLVTDDTNPRSVIYQLRALVDHVRALPQPHDAGVRSPQLRRALAMLSDLELADLSAVDDLLARLAQGLPELNDLLASGYLSHASVQ
jgi:uncharacterized alpha-E superfamily protein